MPLSLCARHALEFLSWSYVPALQLLQMSGWRDAGVSTSLPAAQALQAYSRRAKAHRRDVNKHD